MKRKEVKQKALPTGWREVKLGEVCNVITSPVDKKTVDGELPIKLCNYTDVYYNNTIDSKIDFMTATANHREIEKFSLVKGDVIITKDSETPDDIGVPAYVKETIDNLLCGYHLTILRPKKQTIGKYICYALTSPRVKNNLYRFANGITRFGLTTESYQKIKIPFPSLSEQKAIASLLETWDKAIEKTEALIAAKEKRSKWLVTLLINKASHPKINVSYFTKDVSKRNHDSLIKRVLSVTNHSGFVLPEERFERRIASTDLSNYKIVSKGQYAYNPARINVGSIARLDYWDIGVLSPMYVVFGLDEQKVNSDYFLHCLSSNYVKQRIKNSVQGSVRKTVSFSDLGTIPIPFHSMEIQVHIAKVLNTAKNEIILLQRLAQNYRTQKRGLMQKLITGKWRVNEHGAIRQ